MVILELRLPTPGFFTTLLLRPKFSNIERSAFATDGVMIFADPEWQPANYSIVEVPAPAIPLSGVRCNDHAGTAYSVLLVYD